MAVSCFPLAEHAAQIHFKCRHSLLKKACPRLSCFETKYRACNEQGHLRTSLCSSLAHVLWLAGWKDVMTFPCSYSSRVFWFIHFLQPLPFPLAWGEHNSLWGSGKGSGTAALTASSHLLWGAVLEGAVRGRARGVEHVAHRKSVPLKVTAPFFQVWFG